MKITRGNTAIGVGIFYIIVLFSYCTQAKVVGLFDFDGTLVEDRGPGATWVTPWVLKRLEQLHTGFQQLPNRPVEVTLSDPQQIDYYNRRYGTQFPLNSSVRVSLSLPDQIHVSYDEYHRLEADLAKGEAVFGGLRAVLLNPDPLLPDRELLIVPGYYRSFDLTFKYYRESTGLRAKNYIRADLLQARERTRLLGDDSHWQGYAFPLFQAFMANEISVSNVQIFTSRGHKQTDYAGLWDELVRGGEIGVSKGRGGVRPIVHSLSRPEARIFGRTLAEKKVQVVRGVLESLYHSSGPKHWVENRSGAALRHTLIIAEDEPSYVDAIAQFLLNMSGSYYADRIEMVLVNTGSDLDVQNAKFPYRWTRFEAGRRVRPATEVETANWQDPHFHLMTSKLSPSESCRELLIGSRR